MKQMDIKVANKAVISLDAFIPGDSEDIVAITGNKKQDLQEYLTKILKKEKFYRVKADYFANARGSIKMSAKTSYAMNRSTISGGVLVTITINKVYVFHKSL